MKDTRSVAFKKGHIVILFGIAGLLTLLLRSPAIEARIGEFIWANTKLPGLTLTFDHRATTAVTIGDYYFDALRSPEAYDVARAKHYFLRATIRDPRVPNAWHQLSRIDFLAGDFPQALEKIDRQLAIHGDSFMASYYMRGLIKGYMGSYDEAEQDFKKFLTWDSLSWAAYNDLAWIYFSKGDFGAALSAAEEGLKRNPENPWLMAAAGISLVNLDRSTEGRAFLVRANEGAMKLDTNSWHHAYPGNDPRTATAGLEAMRRAIEHNLSLDGPTVD